LQAIRSGKLCQTSTTTTVVSSPVTESYPCLFESSELLIEVKSPSRFTAVTPELIKQVQEVLKKRLESLGVPRALI
jgi:hypothetical protein